MKCFLIKLGLFVVVHVAILAGALALYIQRFPPSESYYAASVDKHRLLKTRSSPRLVFIGGSSMALGMDTGLVAEPLGFRPINMGMNMGVGLEFMIEEVEQSLKAGDVVIIAPEYHTFQTHYHAEPEYVARLIECHPRLICFLPFRRVKELLDRGYLQHLGRVLRSAIVNQAAGMHDDAVNKFNSRRAFNENGDVVAHHGVAIARGNTLRFEFKSPPTAEAAIKQLNQFHKDCQRRGVRVFYSHAPYERKYFDRYRASIDQLEAMLKAKLTIPMLDAPEDMTFATDEIFDVEYHLNVLGKLHHSERVAERLRNALQISAHGRATK